MGRIKGGPRGGIQPRKRSPAQKAARTFAGDPLQQGDLGEVAFLHRAMGLGFMVARPYGHNHPYDFIVQGGGNLWRVQVKTCNNVRDRLYNVDIRHSVNGVRVAYTMCEVDFVVVYIMPEETWYVMPAREVVGRKNLRFRVSGASHRLDPHAHNCEAWQQLRETDGLTFG